MADGVTTETVTKELINSEPDLIPSHDHFNETELSKPKFPFSGNELSKFSKYSLYLLLLNLFVIAWGVFVRASDSGDGCGSHWPLCDGSKEPLNGWVSRLIEGFHRLSTSLDGILIIVLLIWAYRAYEKGSQVRKAAGVAFLFTLIEGFIGAVLVKDKLVTTNASVFRAEVMSFHVISTFFLVSSITLCAYLGTGKTLRIKGQGAVGWMTGLGFLLVAIMGVSGAISALGHTLDPVKNVLKAAANPHTFWMVRFQPYHPLLALAVGMMLLLIVGVVSNLRPSPRVKLTGALFLWIYGFELVLGFVNITLLAPIWMQMLHLATAEAVIISLAWFSAEVLQSGVRAKDTELYGSEKSVHPKGIALAKEYLALTKPRVISLLLFTTLAAMVATQRGWPGLGLFFWVAVGGYMAAGAANTFNMVVERDLDLAMKRTSTRPTLTAHVSIQSALMFALVLMLGSFAILWCAANILTAVLAEAGLVFYVSIYTLGLKRRTWQNIVIGGAAGAFPPLVGYAAVHNGLTYLALCMFGIIFVWTPVHFWALAILLKDDYESAGVPMLPVVKGVPVTVRQIIGYTVFTILCSFVPLVAHWAGWLYGITVLGLNAYLFVLSLRLKRQPDRARASGLFHYSMLYLALLFMALAADRTFVRPASHSVRVDSLSASAMLRSSGGKQSIVSARINGDFGRQEKYLVMANYYSDKN